MGDYDAGNPFSPMNDVASMPTSNPFASGVADMVSTPGNLMKPNPYKPGSEEADAYDRYSSDKETQWAPAMAMNMVGGSGAFPAEANTLRTGVGIKAKGIDPATYEQFTKLESQGLDPRDNFRATNWYRGDDGQPRYWVSDQGARIKDTALRPTREGMRGEVPGLVTDQTTGRFRGATLGDVLDHPELYEKYPWLKDIKLDRENSKTSSGSWDGDNTITARSDEPGEFMRTLAHETQHVIQGHEGFSPGSNSRAFYTPEIKDLLREYQERLQYAQAKTKSLGIDNAKAWKIANDDPAKMEPADKEVRGLLDKHGLTGEFQAFDRSQKELQNIQNEVYQRYLHTAGESEARDTEEMMKNPDHELTGRLPLHVNKELKPGRKIEVLPAKAAGGGVQGDAGANPFDQFDAPAAAPAGPQDSGGNPFDQFDAAPQGGDQAKPMSWGDVGTQALENAPKSAANFAYDLAQPFMHPIETAKSVKNIGLGLGEKAGVLSGDEHKKYPDAVGKFFSDRYGGMENFKKTLAEDPVGAAGDLSMLLSGGETALGRAPGLIGRVGEAAGTASRVLDPISTGVAAGVNKVANKVGETLSPTRVAPTTRELFDAADNNYSNMRGFGVEIDPRAVGNLHSQIMTDLHTQGYRQLTAPKTLSAVDELLNQPGRFHTIDDIEAPRRALNKAAEDRSERGASRQAVEHIDNFLANLNPRDVRVNPQFAQRVAQEATEARGNYAAARRAETVDESLRKAARQAGRTGSGTNIDNATRQKISQIVDNPKKARGFNAPEREEMNGIVQGSRSANALRWAGKMAPSGVVSATLGAALGYAAGLPKEWWLAPAAAGYALKKGADYMTQSRAERFGESVRRRAPAGAGYAPRQDRLYVSPTPFKINRMKGQLADNEVSQFPNDNPYAMAGNQ